ncbi:MAG TPA: polysaccharide biosynthesis/export family protein [Stenotrophomonas sp.]|uniref:polysaccharide biosynthesis/export family protein n=1 Tax=Stenotrophomonas pigmentata TaxID=3055080 RepID=UPI0026EFE49F|nr:polysaccharide biosynthesis/export family protein [Stenotrophomonas sp. 610A2]
MKSLRLALPALLILLFTACAMSNVVQLPTGKVVRERQISNFSPDQLPKPVLKVHTGDVLRIVRDAQTPAEKDEATLYRVRPDGNIAYPFIGIVKAGGRTPEAIGEELTERLDAIYREPRVTINIAEAPGSRVYVGGAVRNPGTFDLMSAVTVPQAITATGGVLPTADSHHVALVRQDDEGVQQVYFFDYAALLGPATNGQPGVQLQRGDLVFVPSSRIGNAIQRVDMYVGQLLMFRGFGASANYQINEPSYRINTPEVTVP